MKTQSVLAVIFIVILSLPVIPDAATSLTVERIEYCKINRNRIMTFEFTGLPTTDDMKDYVENHPPRHTNRRMTAAYFFPKGSKTPQSGFSLCSSIAQANSLLYESKIIDSWEFAYMVSPIGKTTLVNCMESPNNGLCKP